MLLDFRYKEKGGDTMLTGMRYKKIKAADCQLLLKSFCGPGGSRTLVQTRKPYAFYMLISAFGFRV